MQTCWNDLSLNLCIVSPMSCIVAISENSLVRSYKKRSKVHCHLASTLVDYQASYYKVITSLKYIK